MLGLKHKILIDSIDKRASSDQILVAWSLTTSLAAEFATGVPPFQQNFLYIGPIGEG